MDNKPSIFVITPFNDDFIALFNQMKEHFKDQYMFTNAGDLDNQQNILQDIVEGIYKADVVIADLTGLNANVFYELGLAHAMNKKVIIITQDIGELPFDIKSYRANEYSMLFYKIPELFCELEKLLKGAIDCSVKYGNPVADYIPNFFHKTTSTQISMGTITGSVSNTTIDTKDTEDDTFTDRGFIDYMAEIQENSCQMTTEITAICKEMDDMNISIKNAANEINKIKPSGGNTTVSFARNVCRKLSSPIEVFATKLKTRVHNVSIFWEHIENDYLSLLENQHFRSSSNIDELKKSVLSLEEMQNTIYEADAGIENLIDALRPSLGVERKLSKAITTLINELEEYLSMTEKISSSIDRIVSKSEVIINSEI